ncbi:uncharacterized protein LOC5504802 [Nematostella vectensis]|uniref:uncharacterized protein LOC5504802 n=1 Tax=Nematostella vectensis TaxID=45351 RepID=UPI00207730DE|nr:uncharacterized protein LOC5504802 [Nematostella vectensis]XP_048586360.1 uncharacterized protein LOC5504802 [Nematostella vectensis]
MKISFGVPSESKEKSLYIKRSYIDLYINALKTDLTCAVPLTNLTAGNGGCKLPKLQKYYEEIMHLVKRLPPITCDVNHLHTKLEHGVLQMRENATKDPQVTSLHARPIRRGKNDDTITYGPPWHFNLTAKSLQVQEDFWEVISILKNKEENKNFHLSVVEKPGIERRMLNNNAPLNIMMMTLDSTSAVHFERMLPKTYDFLSQEFGSYVFKGFSVVGDGTAPYMSAVLTGRPWDENTKQWSEPDGTVDRWPFVFKKFEKKGFVTMFSEDFSHLGAFNYFANGFKEPPSDHFGRPFWLATSGLCCGGQPQVRLQFNYLKSFIQAYPGRRKFGYTFLCDIGHRRVNTLSAADLEFLTFLKTAKEENLFNETLLIINSDHGPRFGEIRFTNQGKMEERMPFLSVYIPEWFKKKFPKLAENLQRNTNVIISPYDLHATFLDLMDFPSNTTSNTYGTSLLRKLALNRTCADAHIDEQWCPCLTWIPVSTSHLQVVKAARKALDHINELLATNPSSRKLCHRLELKKVISAHQKMANMRVQDKAREDECSYQIQFEVRPSGGVFEALVKFFYSGEIEVQGTISRINMYGTQPDCILKKAPTMRGFCYCK